jgi:hypothetical protein
MRGRLFSLLILPVHASAGLELGTGRHGYVHDCTLFLYMQEGVQRVIRPVILQTAAQGATSVKNSGYSVWYRWT